MYLLFTYLLFVTVQTPKFEFISNAKPSLFAYPAPLKPPTTAVVEKVDILYNVVFTHY